MSTELTLDDLMRNDLAALSTLAVEINLLNEQVEHHKNQAVIYAARTGEKLLLAKAQCKHGEFGNWLKENCTVSQQHANKFMKLATEMPQLLDLNYASMRNLPNVTQAIEMLYLPEEIREEVTAKIEAGEDVTVKEIQRLKKEAAEAKEKLDQANKRQMDLSVKLDSKQEEIATLVNQKWILENQQQQIIEAKLAEERAKLILENQQAIAENKRLAENAQAELERLKREQEKAITDGVTLELNKLTTEINQKRYQIEAYERDLTDLKKVKSELDVEVGALAVHKEAIKQIKNHLSFLTTSFADAFDTSVIPAEVAGEWDAIYFALSKLKKQMSDWRDSKAPIDSEVLIGELVD